MKWALWGVKINSDYLPVWGKEAASSCRREEKGKPGMGPQGAPPLPGATLGGPGWRSLRTVMLRLSLCPEAAPGMAEAWPRLSGPLPPSSETPVTVTFLLPPGWSFARLCCGCGLSEGRVSPCWVWRRSHGLCPSRIPLAFIKTPFGEAPVSCWAGTSTYHLEVYPAGCH